MTARPLLHGWTAQAAYERRDVGWPAFATADGVEIYDEDGIAYLDARSLMCNVSFGHGAREVLQAAIEQMQQLACGPTLDGQSNAAADRFAADLLDAVPMPFSHVYLSLSGTAACEAAIVLARLHHRLQGRPDKRHILSLTSGFHGQSIGMSGISGYSPLWEVMDRPDIGGVRVPGPHCYRCPWDRRPETCCLECAEAVVARIRELGGETIAAMMIEPVQGAVVQAPPPGYFARLRQVLRDNDILLIADEAITGFGRVGAPFASQLYDLQPDILCLAKAMTNGVLPIAATLASETVMAPILSADQVLPFGSTQDGNPVCAAAGSATLALFRKQDWAERARRMGSYLAERLRSELAPCMIFGELRQVGLMLAIELVEDRTTRRPLGQATRLHRALKAQKLLVNVVGGTLIVAPPLILEEIEADEIVRRLVAVVRALDLPVAEMAGGGQTVEA